MLAPVSVMLAVGIKAALLEEAVTVYEPAGSPGSLTENGITGEVVFSLIVCAGITDNAAVLIV